MSEKRELLKVAVAMSLAFAVVIPAMICSPRSAREQKSADSLTMMFSQLHDKVSELEAEVDKLVTRLSETRGE